MKKLTGASLLVVASALFVTVAATGFSAADGSRRAIVTSGVYSGGIARRVELA